MLERQKTLTAFTLIELLVVVAIIMVLLGILIPTTSKARESAKRTQCASNLRSIGQGIRMYMDEYHGCYPPMAKTKDAESVHTNPRPMMNEVLLPFVQKQDKIFKCPSDRFIKDDTHPADKQTWFDWQGTSYEAVSGLSFNTSGSWDLSRENRFTEMMSKALTDAEDLTKIPIVHDYEDFHGDPSSDYSKMALFADFHVDGLGTK